MSGLSLSQVKKLYGERVYKQVKEKIALEKKMASSKSSGSALSKNKNLLSPKKNESPYEQVLFDIFKEVFHEYTVSSQDQLIPGRKFKVDVLVHELKLVGELDGYLNHGFNKEGFKRDRIKDRLLKLEGFEVLRFFASEIASVPDEARQVLYKMKAIREKLMGLSSDK